MSEENRSPEPGYQKKLRALGDKLGFIPENLKILRLALTHSTFFEGNRCRGKNNINDDNQRLEFLGDAVINLVIGEYLYTHYPEAREGQLSKMRAYLVCEASLAEAARTLSLEQNLLMGKGAVAGGDRNRPSVQADAFEAVMGAVYLTQGYQKSGQLILHQFASRLGALAPEDYEDKKSMLQELVQTFASHGVVYRVLAQSGPDHQPRFESGAYCGKLLLGKGEGGSKKESEVAAAAAALKNQEQWLESIKIKER